MAFIAFAEETFSQPITFQKYLISSGFTQGCEVFIYDINKDGHPDIVGGGNGNNGQVVWWENTGYHSFTKHTVAENLKRVRSVSVYDLNADGEADIVAAAWEGNTVSWFENDGAENWTRHIIDDNFTGAHTVDVKDVDADGQADVLCSSFDNSAANSEIAWWKNSLPDTNWTKHVISTRFKQSPFIHGDDIDGDGDTDILACGELNGEVYWWENDGMQNWTEHMIDNNFPKAHTVFIRDVDLDDDMDIVGAACMSSKIAWWENDGNESFTKHSMGSFAGALWFDVADLDMDGDMDFYGGGQGESSLAWWENDGNQDFAKHYLEDPFTQTFCVVHGDLDGDGEPDLAATGYFSNETSWFANGLIRPNIYDKPECVVYDQALDRYIVANVGDGSIVETDTLNNTEYWKYGYGEIYGMCIEGNVLYTSDGDNLMGFHLLSGEEVLNTYIPNLNNLDGMTSDGQGFLYIIDTGGRLIKFDLDEETWEILVDSGLPNWPQDCVYDPFNNRIVIAAYQQSSPVVGVDTDDGTVSTLTTNSTGLYDGITIDQYGNFYLGSHTGSGKVYKYPNDFSNRTMLAYGLGQPTGLNYNQQEDILAVPSFNKDTVFFIKISTTALDENEMEGHINFDVYPNPARGKANIRFRGPSSKHIKSELIDISGRKSRVLFEGALNRDQLTFETNGYDPGLYLVRVSTKNRAAVKKLVIR
jgi:hypothetical protein